MATYSEYANEIDVEELPYEQDERTSDIRLPPVINTVLFAVWVVACLIGFAVVFLGNAPVAGVVIMGVPTFIGMVLKPTFAMCIMMLVLPTGAGVGYREIFSLERGVGLAVGASFLLNLLITRPKLQIGNKALWVLILYTVWASLVSLTGPYLRLELERGFTTVQLLALVFIVYWIMQTNFVKTFHWTLRAYILGTVGTVILTFMTGAAVRSLEADPEQRYAATLGEVTDANMLAGLIAMAFLAAIYLFARDRNLLWRVVYLGAMVFLPIMMLKVGSRGGLMALAVTLLSPLLFVRQVLRKPALAGLVVVVIIVAAISAGLLVQEGGLTAPVVKRLTDVSLVKEALDHRIAVVKEAVASATIRPFGTTYYGWFERTGQKILPHADFFLALGVYGIPGAALFALFVIMMLLTVKRMPLGLEKLYVRAVLTFLLVMGLTVGQLFQKHFWVFLALVMAGERIAQSAAGGPKPAVEEPEERYEESVPAQRQEQLV